MGVEGDSVVYVRMKRDLDYHFVYSFSAFDKDVHVVGEEIM